MYFPYIILHFLTIVTRTTKTLLIDDQNSLRWKWPHVGFWCDPLKKFSNYIIKLHFLKVSATLSSKEWDLLLHVFPQMSQNVFGRWVPEHDVLKQFWGLYCFPSLREARTLRNQFSTHRIFSQIIRFLRQVSNCCLCINETKSSVVIL